MSGKKVQHQTRQSQIDDHVSAGVCAVTAYTWRCPTLTDLIQHTACRRHGRVAPPCPNKAVLWPNCRTIHDPAVSRLPCRRHRRPELPPRTTRHHSSIAASPLQCTMQVVASAGDPQQAQAGGLLAAKRLGFPGTPDFSKRHGNISCYPSAENTRATPCCAWACGSPWLTSADARTQARKQSPGNTLQLKEAKTLRRN